MDAYIRAAFWTDQRIEDLDPEAKLAALWIITNPSRDLCGFTSVSNKRFTFEIGLAPAVLQQLCKALPSSFYAPSKGVVFAVNFLRHQFGKGGHISPGNKVIIAATRHARSLPQPLTTAFFQAYPELLKEEENQDPPSMGDTPNREGVRVEKSKSREKVIVLPHGQPFAAAWEKWQRHRSEIRKPLKPTMIEAQLAELGALTEAQACRRIHHTISMGWQGLRDPEGQPAGPPVKLNLGGRDTAKVIQIQSRQKA